MFLDKSSFDLPNNNSCRCIKCCHGEPNLRTCIVEQYSEQMGSVIVGATLEMNCVLESYIFKAIWSSVATIGRFRARGTAPPSGNSSFHISAGDASLACTHHFIFQQCNARSHVVRILQALFKEWLVSLLSWPAQTCLGYGWLAICHGPPKTIFDTLLIHKHAWRDIPLKHIQALFYSKCRLKQMFNAINYILFFSALISILQARKIS